MNLKQTLVGWGMVLALATGILWAIYSVQDSSALFVQSVLLSFYVLVDIAGFSLILSLEPKVATGAG